MLLYAKTVEKQQPQHKYKINGKHIFIQNINLNQEFPAIKKDLLNYIAPFFDAKT